MFGLSIGEIMILLLVGIIVVGPKNLPSLMRTAGQWVSKLRRMSTDLRSQSGIDDLIRQEGLEREINELRSLSRMNVVDTLMTPALTAPAVAPRAFTPKVEDFKRVEPLREREYPLVGCDAAGALADDVVPYHDGPEPRAPEEPKSPEPAATEPAATEPAATEPAATEPAATEPGAAAEAPAAAEAKPAQVTEAAPTQAAGDRSEGASP